MLTKTNALGITGELLAMAKFTQQGFEVFAPVSDGNSQIDFIAIRDKVLVKVNVKSTTTRSGKSGYCVSLRATSPGSISSLSKNKPFDKKICDILAVYIQPLHKICFINTKEITSTTTLILSETVSKNATKQWLISDYIDLNRAIAV